jgi:hypothetical protein
MMRLNFQGAAEGRPLSIYLVAHAGRREWLSKGKIVGDDWVRQYRPRGDLGAFTECGTANSKKEAPVPTTNVVPYVLRKILSAEDC